MAASIFLGACLSCVIESNKNQQVVIHIAAYYILCRKWQHWPNRITDALDFFGNGLNRNSKRFLRFIITINSDFQICFADACLLYLVISCKYHRKTNVIRWRSFPRKRIRFSFYSLRFAFCVGNIFSPNYSAFFWCSLTWWSNQRQPVAQDRVGFFLRWSRESRLRTSWHCWDGFPRARALGLCVCTYSEIDVCKENKREKKTTNRFKT